MKANYAGLLFGTVVCGAILVLWNIGTNFALLAVGQVVKSLIVGAVISGAGTLVATLAGKSSLDTSWFAVGTSLSAAALMYALSVLQFDQVNLVSCAVAGFLGLLTGLGASFGARVTGSK